MSPLFAGRPTLVVPLLLLSLTFFLFVGLTPSHPRSHEAGHALQQRKVTVTDQVSTTVFITGSTTISESTADISSTSSSPSRHHRHSTSVSSSFSTPSILSSSSTGTSSSSHTASQKHQTSRTSTSTSSSQVRTPSPRSTTHALVPSPIFSTSATPLSVTDEPFTLTSASPTVVAPILPTSSASVFPVQATSNGFWSNKGAVGGVFTVISLVIAGIISFLLIAYVKRIKRIRSQRYDEELFSNYFNREHSRRGSSPGPDSLNYPSIDPFAAGEVVQVPGGIASLHRGIGGGVVSGPSSPSSKIGHGGYSSDDGHSSHGHSSSMHHGFSSISYHTGSSDTRTNFVRPESPLPSRLPKSVPPPLSTPEYHPENPFSNAAAVSLSANTASSAYTIPSPFLGAGQVNNHQEAGSDASYYADQIHSYYYGAGARAPLDSRSIGQAF